MIYSLHRTKAFRKDVKKMRRRDKDMRQLQRIVGMLQHGMTLPQQQREHVLLIGRYNHAHNVHVQPDWVLLYLPVGNCLKLLRTGTHADLF